MKSMEIYGAFVGRRGKNLGDRIVLTIESIGAGDAKQRKKPGAAHLLVNTQQAAVLGDCLIEISG